MAQEDINLDFLWDFCNFAVAGVIDATATVVILIELFLDKLDSAEGFAHYVIGGVGGFFFATLSYNYYLSYLQMCNKKEWAEKIIANERILIFCTPLNIIWGHSVGFNAGFTITGFFLEGDFANYVAWTKLITTIFGIANTMKTSFSVRLPENDGYAVSSYGNHLRNDRSDAV